MGIISYQIPVPGQQFSTEGPKVDSALTTLLTLVNGNIDETNVTAALAQSAGVNVGGVGAKGVTVNAGPGTRTNVAYGALNDAADQVTGIVLPTSGLITVWYQATWQESAAGAARAAIFIGANQQAINVGTTSNAQSVAAATSGPGGLNVGLFSHSGGLGSTNQSIGTYTEGTTGTAIGGTVLNGKGLFWEINGVVVALGPTMGVGQAFPIGGPCYIFAAAGTYTVSVQFKATSGTVTASNRKLWVKAESFA